jgi:hypothetical protein
MRIQSKDIEKYRLKIWKLIHTQPAVYVSGVVEINGVSDFEKDRIIRTLSQQDFISDINISRAKYDFSHLNFKKGFAEPSNKYDIRCVISKEINEAATPKDRYRWTYNGEVYRFGDSLGFVDLETIAVSPEAAINNFLFKAAAEFGYDRSNGDNIDIDRFDIVQHEKVAPKKKAPSKKKVETPIIVDKKIKYCDNCGQQLNDAGECPVCDLGDESVLDESVSTHQILNPKLWDANNKLFPEIKTKVEEIVRAFKKMLLNKDVDLHIIDAYILGSNANYNYTDVSDFDIHIIVDEDNDCVKKHLPIIYDAYRSLFDKKYDITIKGIEVELYVQSKESALNNVSSGVYSIKEDKWLKMPVKEFAKPEIDDVKFSAAVNDWERRYFKIKMNPTIDAIDSFVDDIYAIRAESLSNEGEFGFDNLVFKEIRNLGYIRDLKDLKDSLTAQSLSLE